MKRSIARSADILRIAHTKDKTTFILTYKAIMLSDEMSEWRVATEADLKGRTKQSLTFLLSYAKLKEFYSTERNSKKALKEFILKNKTTIES